MVALLAVMAVMFALVGVSVPLYRLFCQATGYGGTTQRAERAPGDSQSGRLITVRFDAETSPSLPWDFAPVQRSVQVHLGEEKVIYYRATNRRARPSPAPRPSTSRPTRSGSISTSCNASASRSSFWRRAKPRSLSVSFFVDPDIVKDHNADDVDTITLSYTMFRAAGGTTKPLQSYQIGQR